MTGEAQGLLRGVRVLDASRVLAGPLCGQVLGDLGAEVVKIERPGVGDETRAWGPPFHTGKDPSSSVSAYFLSCNRNKQAMTLDLANPEGQALFHELVRHSDVVLENYRPDSAQRLGLSFDQLQAVNPRVVVCSISGFGRSGPWQDRPGYDFAIQALSGLMAITGPGQALDGDPRGATPFKVGVAVTDVLTGLQAALAVLACLHARQRTGHGYHIDLALLDCALAAQVNVAQAFLTSGKVPVRQGNAHLQIVPYQLFRTSDSWLVLAVGNDGQWQRFCRAAERPDLAQDSRFATNPLRVQNRNVLVPMLEEEFGRRTTEDWIGRLQEQDVPYAPVWTYADLFAHPQAQAREFRLTIHDSTGEPLDLVGTPYHISPGGSTDQRFTETRATDSPLPPPMLGQHTDQILSSWLGLDESRCADLRARGVI